MAEITTKYKAGQVVYPIGSTQPLVVLDTYKGFVRLPGMGMVFEDDVRLAPIRTRSGARMRALRRSV